MAADSGRPQRGMCSRAHGKRAEPIGYKLSRGKAFFYPAFGTTNLSTGTPEASSCGGLKPVIYLCSSMKLAFFMDIEVLTGCLSMKLAFFMDIEVWIGSLAIKPAFIIADEVRQGGRTVLQARRPTHNYPRGDPGRGKSVRGDPVRGDPGRGNSGRGNPDRGDPGRGDPGRGNPDRGVSGRGGNAHFADNPCLFTGKMVYLRPHNFRAG